jgi:hypothetical protein
MTPTNGFQKEDTRDPAGDLCALVERRGGFRIPKVTMEAMFLAEWQKLSRLAHAIHERQQRRVSALDPKNQYRGPL